MITMTELTLGNFIPVARFLTETIDEGYGLGILVYKVVVGLGVLRVLAGIFLHETFKAAASDDELMVVQKRRVQEKHREKMMRLFNAANPAGKGYIRRHQFANLLQDPKVKTWLSAQDIEAGDGLLLFDLMDDGDQKLSALELVQGIARLKGAARSLDVIGLMHMTSHLSSLLEKISPLLSHPSPSQVNVSKDAKLNDTVQDHKEFSSFVPGMSDIDSKLGDGEFEL